MTHHLETILNIYTQHNIKLSITPKRVKNINFRIKPINEPPFTSLLVVSYPVRMPQNLLIQSLQNRLDWAIDCQQKQFNKKNLSKKSTYFNDIQTLENLTLESEIYFEGEKITVQNLLEKYLQSIDFTRIDIPKTIVQIYKFWLIQFIASRQDYWEYKVGKQASKITPYIMKSRWGSCSTHAKTIRLSIWLAQFPPSCTDYVLVHELCHLHHADHSARFWACVERVMPDYQTWHKMLKSGLDENLM